MRRTTPMKFGDLWDEFIDSNPKAAKGLAEARAAELWPSIVGPGIASYTENINIVKGVMYVKMSSPAARNEIFLRREELKVLINKAVGMNVANVIIVK